MTTSDIVDHRLTNQRLNGPTFSSAKDTVAWLGAVQAQDYAGAKWAVGQRIKDATDASIEDAFTKGDILRTHVLRPTWHFVAPQDIKWIQMLTAPRVDAFCKYYYKKLELDDDTFKKGSAALVKALQGGKQLIRSEVAQVYKDAKIDASGLRLAYLTMRSELDALVCSGAMRGKQHTIALVAERAPQAKTLTQDEALAELTKRYFTGHGPAQLQDFAWWSSLTQTHIKRGVEMLGSYLTSELVNGKTYWFVPTKATKLKPPIVHLLPNYDEFLIAYKDHSPSTDPAISTVSMGRGAILFANHIIALNGLVVGGWQRRPAKNRVEITLRLIKKLDAGQQQALNQAVEKLSDFLDQPVVEV